MAASILRGNRGADAIVVGCRKGHPTVAGNFVFFFFSAPEAIVLW